LPERTNEITGVLHLKIYLFDDKLIMSGANLSNDYFTNRLDRYILINDCGQLGDFFESLISTISNYSFRVQANGNLTYSNQNGTDDQTNVHISDYHPYFDDLKAYCESLGKSVHKVLNAYSKDYNEVIETVLNEKVDTNAYIFPLIQMNDCSIKTDHDLTIDILKSGTENSYIYLTTGYFNLTDNYIASIVNNSQTNFKILLPSLEANGFHKAQGFSSIIPYLYFFYEAEFFKCCERLKKDIDIFEYKRKNWTFHAKGMWYYPSNNNHLPIYTIIGSSNYGYRSVFKDVEAQVLIYSKNKDLQAKFDDERKKIFDNKYLIKVNEYTISSTKLSKLTKLVAKFARNYL
jgi:CDP-diacylglycerol--glycerol-3-phosphate 3-phosphatidyltransferase